MMILRNPLPTRGVDDPLPTGARTGSYPLSAAGLIGVAEDWINHLRQEDLVLLYVYEPSLLLLP